MWRQRLRGDRIRNTVSSWTTAQMRVLRTSPTFLSMIYQHLVTGLPTLMTKSTVLRPHQPRRHQPRLHLPTSPANALSISPRLKIASQTPRTSTHLLLLKTAQATTSAIRASIPPRNLLASESTMGRHIVSKASCQIYSSSLGSMRTIISSLHMGA